MAQTSVQNNIEDSYFFECPHCSCYCQVPKSQVNCGIFRHAVYSKTDLSRGHVEFQPINPHASKEECEKLKSEGVVLGCAQPFQLRVSQGSMEGSVISIQKCDFI